MRHHQDHMDRAEDRVRHRFEAMARRGFNFPGMSGFGGDGPGDFGENFRIGRMLASGDLRLVVLYLLEQQPRHGYDLIKVIEERTSGLYSPSPGVIYPALTFLEEAGYVTAIPEGNKKAYQITDEGRAHLDQNRTAVEATLKHLETISKHWTETRDKLRRHIDPRPDRDIPDAVPELNEARRAIKDAIVSAMRGGADMQRRAAEILRQAAAEIQKDDIDL